MVEALGISLTEFIFYLINFLILVGALAKFLYKPFIEMMENSPSRTLLTTLK